MEELKELKKIVELLEKYLVEEEIKCFEIEYDFPDRTDASLHTEIIQGESEGDAIYALLQKYPDAQWLTIKRLKHNEKTII